MNKGKTAMQWLEQAKADGEPWANAAIKNCTQPALICDSKADAVLWSFSWIHSPEGWEHWKKIWIKL